MLAGAEGSQVSWAANPPGVAVVLSGGVRLQGLDWQPTAANPKIFVADVSGVPSRALLQSDAERHFWAQHTKNKARRETQRQRQQAQKHKEHVARGDDPMPAAPPGWQAFAGHCMDNSGCHAPHCGCADPPVQLKDVQVPDAATLAKTFQLAQVCVCVCVRGCAWVCV